MFNMINDSVRFPEALRKVDTIVREYNTYPYRVYQASIALQGIDYGFSDKEGMFYRCTINSVCKIIDPYRVQVSLSFGIRSREFDKRTDATVSYVILLQEY
ncbi:MAG: hypothetical protein Q8942_04305 [Bacillota bacterium]|nr:hypothetical protein [Bacillota bacterium]